jgi:hypothetical protein
MHVYTQNGECLIIERGVRSWHLTDISPMDGDFRYWGYNGHQNRGSHETRWLVFTRSRVKTIIDVKSYLSGRNRELARGDHFYDCRRPHRYGHAYGDQAVVWGIAPLRNRLLPLPGRVDRSLANDLARWWPRSASDKPDRLARACPVSALMEQTEAFA